jgi:hypothetical protein
MTPIAELGVFLAREAESAGTAVPAPAATVTPVVTSAVPLAAAATSESAALSSAPAKRKKAAPTAGPKATTAI